MNLAQTALFVFSTLLMQSVWAFTISGEVLDVEKKPVAAASVQLRGVGMKTTTGVDGSFVLKESSTSLNPRFFYGTWRDVSANTPDFITDLQGRVLWKRSHRDPPYTCEGLCIAYYKDPTREEALVNALAKSSAAMDILEVTAEGFNKLERQIELKDTNLGTLTLARVVASGNSKYLTIAKAFADSLLSKGIDHVGPKKTHFWAAVMDAQNLTIPSGSVPECCGIRSGDRAVAGTNLLHDAAAVQAFPVLSHITGNPDYENAAKNYVKDYLSLAQGGDGLLFWGEHRFFNIHTDKQAKAGVGHHEFLEVSPPWKLMREANSAAVTREVDAIANKHSCCASDPGKCGWQFNRHSNNCPTGDAMPWVKHAGLFALANAAQFSASGESRYKERALGFGLYHWKKRNSTTNIPPSCPELNCDQTGGKAAAGVAASGLYAYFLFKAYLEAPTHLDELRAVAINILKVMDKYAWDGTQYHDVISGTGGRVAGAAPLFDLSYGEASALYLGLPAAFIANRTKDSDLRRIAERVAGYLNKQSLPSKPVPMAGAYAIMLNLELYQLTGSSSYLDKAEFFADQAIDRTWNGKLFTRVGGDRYYEAKTGAGQLFAALVRLHLVTTGAPDPGLFDWGI